jgi:hypothetical protein
MSGLLANLSILFNGKFVETERPVKQHESFLSSKSRAVVGTTKPNQHPLSPLENLPHKTNLMPSLTEIILINT